MSLHRECRPAAWQYGRSVLCVVLFSGCRLYGCQAPGTTISEYLGKLGQSTATAGAAEAEAGVVTINLFESDAAGSIDQAMITVAKPGLSEFGEQLHVHDRRNGATVLTSGFGYYRTDSLIFRSAAEHESGKRRWDNFKNAVDAGRAYFELHSATAVDTAGIRLVSRRHEAGGCT